MARLARKRLIPAAGAASEPADRVTKCLQLGAGDLRSERRRGQKTRAERPTRAKETHSGGRSLAGVTGLLRSKVFSAGWFIDG